MLQSGCDDNKGLGPGGQSPKYPCLENMPKKGFENNNGEKNNVHNVLGKAVRENQM